MNLKSFYTYILESLLNGAYYVGSCKDIKIRLRVHNSGLVKSTGRYTPWKLVYFEKFNTLSVARKRELQIKSWKSRAAIKNLIKKFQVQFIEDPR